MAVQQIVEYIRQYRHAYTRKSIDRQLLGASYTQDDIAAAWNAVEIAEAQPDGLAEPQPTRAQMPVSASSYLGDEHALSEDKPKKVINSPTFWSVLVGFVVLSYSLPTLFLVTTGRDERGVLNFGYAYPGLIAGAIVQLIAIVWGNRIRSTNRPLAMGLLIGVLVTVVVLPLCALVLFVVVFLPRLNM